MDFAQAWNSATEAERAQFLDAHFMEILSLLWKAANEAQREALLKEFGHRAEFLE
jgi:hypothetical protein